MPRRIFRWPTITAPDGDEWMYGNAAHERLTDSEDWREDIDLMTHRYMTEDMELGLAFLVSCAGYLGLDAPVSNGLLALGSAITGRDFRETGRTLKNLGLADLDRDALAELLYEGIRKMTQVCYATEGTEITEISV